MNRIILILILATSITNAQEPDKEDREFALTAEYFNWHAKQLDYYPFAEDLKKIDEGISGEYSYCWSIGWPQARHVVQAAALGDYDRVLVGWWRTNDRAARVASLAVFYCTAEKTDTSNFPQFQIDAKRFKDKEAKARLEEIEFVTANLPYFRKWLKSLVSDNLPKEAKFLKALEGK